ncbi:uncharacterized protein LOC120658419 [Panicum virgatum]|uniref:uncharacterized protein LOC120658419 n=1 Tax=Panicum virgatum TaxID=38727 RepID=UPI0019D520D0|nr:uncharacterized protein LOC120658419 [Panicum virgatum]
MRPVPTPLPGTGVSASPTPSPPCLLPPAPARSPPPCRPGPYVFSRVAPPLDVGRVCAVHTPARKPDRAGRARIRRAGFGRGESGGGTLWAEGICEVDVWRRPRRGLSYPMPFLWKRSMPAPEACCGRHGTGMDGGAEAPGHRDQAAAARVLKVQVEDQHRRRRVLWETPASSTPFNTSRSRGKGLLQLMNLSNWNRSKTAAPLTWYEDGPRCMKGSCSLR